MPTVRHTIRLVEQDGWELVRIRGSHPQFKHPVKRGRVTIAGPPSKHVPIGLWRSILRQAGLRERRS